jgi:hypothetical protein
LHKDDKPLPTGTTGLTAADKLRDEYKKIGDAQKHKFGEGLPGTLPPNFNLKVPGVNAPALPAAQANPSNPVSPGSTTPARPLLAPPAVRPPPPPVKEPQP